VWIWRISLATHLVGDADLYLAVEAPGAPECGIDAVDAVRRADDDHLSARFEAVHHRQQLRDDAALNLAGHVLALRRDRVELVDEDDARLSSFASSKISRSCCSDSP